MAEMNQTPDGMRTRIAFFGRRNAGKSSLINALTGQDLAIVSDVPGTTTDPVSKAMEILPLGPCLVTDTAGLDDEGELGAMRVAKTLAVLEVADIAVVVIPCGESPDEAERRLLAECERRGVKSIIVRSKRDLAPEAPVAEGEVPVSAATGEGVEALRVGLSRVSVKEPDLPLLADLVSHGDIVVCVCPIDASAPKGRLILPQQQVVRELLDLGCVAVVCQPAELPGVFVRIGEGNVRFVVTDSQAFKEVDAATPKGVPLTSFSILFARRKGDLRALCAGAAAMKSLKDGDRVLIAEGCTHHRQCGDIGTVKLPQWISKYTGRRLEFEFSSGGTFPLDEADLPALVVHCGGCMLTRRAVMARIARCEAAGVPIVNYGVAIALMHGMSAKPGSCMVER